MSHFSKPSALTAPKVAVVTGGTSGIGLAAVAALEARGCTVYALSRHGDIPCDVADETSARAAVQQVLEKEGRVDVLVNCAGFGISGAAELTPLDLAKKQLDVNLFGTANMVNAVIPAMRKQGGGQDPKDDQITKNRRKSEVNFLIF